jgi:hypothetical protein
MNTWDPDPFAKRPGLESIRSGGIVFRPGDRIRLRPRRGGDVFDLALSGKTAVIASIEEDLVGRAHLAVTIEDDPGRDLGEDGKPGHRFFFHPDEVEPVTAEGDGRNP